MIYSSPRAFTLPLAAHAHAQRGVMSNRSAGRAGSGMQGLGKQTSCPTAVNKTVTGLEAKIIIGVLCSLVLCM